MKERLKKFLKSLMWYILGPLALALYLTASIQIGAAFGGYAFLGVLLLPLIALLVAPAILAFRETQEVADTAWDKLPTIAPRFRREARDCSEEYMKLRQMKCSYVELMHAMGLDKPQNYYTMDTVDCISHELAIIKHSEIQPTEIYFQQLQFCIDFLQRKEKLLQKVEKIQLSVEKHLTREEIESIYPFSLTCAILSVDEAFLFYSELTVYNPEYDEQQPWRITSHNLSRLLQELQTNPHIHDIIASRPQRKLPDKRVVLF